MANEVTCRYKNCLHNGDKLLKTEAVLDGKSTYYHPDCYQTKQEIQEIVRLFEGYVTTPVMRSQLYSVINNIVFAKSIGSNFLLFALKRHISKKLPLNYPAGLNYIITDKSIKDEFYRHKVKQEMPKTAHSIKEDSGVSFNYKQNDGKTLENLFD